MLHQVVEQVRGTALWLASQVEKRQTSHFFSVDDGSVRGSNFQFVTFCLLTKQHNYYSISVPNAHPHSFSVMLVHSETLSQHQQHQVNNSSTFRVCWVDPLL